MAGGNGNRGDYMIRSVEQLKKRLDLMIRDYGAENITLEHGCCNFQFTKYFYYPYGYDEELKQWNDTEKIIIFCIDLTTKKERQYMEITDEDLRRPKGEYDYNHWFVHANWQKKYPTILELADYEFKEWMEKCGAV